MRLFLSVRGKGQIPISRKQFCNPEFPCKMLFKLWGKMPVFGKRVLEVECEDAFTLQEFRKEMERISEDFLNEFNDGAEKKTLELLLEGKASDAYKIKNTVPSYGYDVYVV